MTTFPRTGKRRCGLWPIIIALTLVALAIVIFWFLLQPRPNHNALAIGQQVSVEYLDIALQPPGELDFKSKKDVLALRTGAVQAYLQLVAGEYRPSDAVFGQIVDGLPWWGVFGAFYYGQGEQSIAGPSEQSLSILNPFLLAVPELYMRWDQTSITEAETHGLRSPLYCAPIHLRWFPANAYADVVYSAACLQKNNVRFFSLIAYNARDWNLNHIFVSYPNSQNITKRDPPTVPFDNPQYLHRGNSCGYPGGCNNISPQTPAIDSIEITAWPAKAELWFWRDAPGSTAEQPDMVFAIYFN